MAELIIIGFIFFPILALTFMKVNLWMSLLGTAFLGGLLFHLPVVKMGMDLLSARPTLPIFSHVPFMKG
jgi:hypothetical protein